LPVAVIVCDRGLAGAATADGFCAWSVSSVEKGIRWMPWHQEARKDVARCEKPRGAASRR
jgi:hypothetical protein